MWQEPMWREPDLSRLALQMYIARTEYWVVESYVCRDHRSVQDWNNAVFQRTIQQTIEAAALRRSFETRAKKPLNSLEDAPNSNLSFSNDNALKRNNFDTTKSDKKFK